MSSRRCDSALGGSVLLLLALASTSLAETEREFRAIVESDWALQEKRAGRMPGDPQAIRDALRRGERLLQDLSEPGGLPTNGATSPWVLARRAR